MKQFYNEGLATKLPIDLQLRNRLSKHSSSRLNKDWENIAISSTEVKFVWL